MHNMKYACSRWVNWHNNKKFVLVTISEETNNTQLRTVVCLIWQNQWRLRNSVVFVFTQEIKNKKKKILMVMSYDPQHCKGKGNVAIFLYRIQSMELAESNYSTTAKSCQLAKNKYHVLVGWIVGFKKLAPISGVLVDFSLSKKIC